MTPTPERRPSARRRGADQPASVVAHESVPVAAASPSETGVAERTQRKSDVRRRGCRRRRSGALRVRCLPRRSGGCSTAATLQCSPARDGGVGVAERAVRGKSSASAPNCPSSRNRQYERYPRIANSASTASRMTWSACAQSLDGVPLLYSSDRLPVGTAGSGRSDPSWPSGLPCGSRKAVL